MNFILKSKHIQTKQLFLIRLHKNIVSFKHKQYLEFQDHQKNKTQSQTPEPKEKKGKVEAKAKQPTPLPKSKASDTKKSGGNKVNENKSRLLNKYKDLIDSSDSSSDDEAVNATPKSKQSNSKIKEVSKKENKSNKEEVKKSAKKELLSSRSRSNSTDVKQSKKVEIPPRSRSNSSDIKPKGAASKSTSRKCSTEGVADKNVVQNPLWQNNEEEKVTIFFF